MDITVWAFGYNRVFVRPGSTQGYTRLDITEFWILRTLSVDTPQYPPSSSFWSSVVYFMFASTSLFIPSLWPFHTSFHSTIYRYTCLKTTVVTILTVSVRLLSIYHYVRCLYITLLSPFIAFVYIFYISFYVRRSQTVSWRFKSTVFTTSKSLFSQMCS